MMPNFRDNYRLSNDFMLIYTYHKLPYQICNLFGETYVTKSHLTTSSLPHSRNFSNTINISFYN